MKSVLFRRVAVVSLLVAAACAEDESQFNVEYAPGFSKNAPRVSVLGVFRDGRMNAETWDEIGARLSAPFVSGVCPIAYDKDLVNKNEDLANAIDDYARANGVTDGLLDKLSPAANGDDVLVFTVSGHPRASNPDAGVSSASAPPMSSPMGRGGGGGRSHAGAMGPSPMRALERNDFELAASLYSAREHKSVAIVALEYSGTSGADALNKFVAKIRESLPGASCTGWHWDGAPDAKSIRELKEDE